MLSVRVSREPSSGVREQVRPGWWRLGAGRALQMGHVAAGQRDEGQHERSAQHLESSWGSCKLLSRD